MITRLLIMLFLTGGIKLTEAQQPSLYFNKITTQNGLSHNKVNCLAQDQRGFIWIGTDDGLNRYDGKNFTVFRHQPNNPATISGNIINDILEDEKGVLWIATADGGLSRYDYRLPPLQQFKQFKHQPGDTTSIPVNIINALAQDKNGYLWLASGGKSTLRFDKQLERFETPVSTGTRNILDLVVDHNGMIWAGRQGGSILKVNTSNLQYEMDKRYYNLYANLPHATVSSLYQDRNKNIWFGSWDKLLYCFDHHSQQEIAFGKVNGAFHFPKDDILSFAEDSLGRLWMGGRYKGLTLYDPASQHFYNYDHDVLLEGSIADNQVNHVFIDRSGMVWLGTNKGISVYNPAQQPFVQTFLADKNSELQVFDFNKDKSGTLWIGTSAGLFSGKAGSDQFTHHPLSYERHPLSVSKIFIDETGTFFLGTNYSLFVFDDSTHTLQLLPNTQQDKVIYRIIESRVVSMIKDTINNHPVLMVVPYGHYLCYYDFTTRRWVSRMDTTHQIVERYNLQDNLVRKIYKTTAGQIWLANTKHGLGKWQRHPKPYVHFFSNDPLKKGSLSNNHVRDICEDKLGNLWVSTYGGGLNYFNTTTNTATHIEVTNNLLEGLQLDEQGAVWMIGNGHLHKYDPVTQTATDYWLPDLEKSGGVSNTLYKDDEGFMYVAGKNYFIRFHPGQIKQAVNHPRIYVTDFKIFNTSYSHLLLNKSVQLNYNQNYFTFEFAAPAFFKGDVSYAYMLEGFDSDWIECGERNFTNYSNLSGGNYLFKVRATYRKGNWSEEYAVIKVTITPPFWKRWWFYLVIAVVLVAGIYGVYRYRINEILKRQAIRNKIAQDLHDSVGSTLSSISVYSQVAKIQQQKGNYEALQEVVQKISTTSTDMISEMNDIVWTINPRNDSMEKILQRMESFAKPLLQARNITVQFSFEEALLDVNLSMAKRKNFYLVFKEAVNNVLKYSGATHLELTIKLSHHKILFTAADDGVGFDTEKMKVLAAKSLSGNGLNNMKRRAAEMNGTCFIESAPGKGTTLTLTFPAD